MNIQKKYTSIFKIDGVPILPPLITDEKRNELRQYKDLAIALETKFQVESENTNNKITLDTEQTFDDARNFCEIFAPEKWLVCELTDAQKGKMLTKEMLLKEKYDNIKKFIEEDKILRESEKLSNLKKSDTFIYDIITNTVIIPFDGDIKDEQFVRQRNSSIHCGRKNQSMEEKYFDNNNKTTQTNMHEECNINSTMIPISKDSFTALASTIPAICVKPPTPDRGKIDRNDAEQNDFSKKHDTNFTENNNKSSNSEAMILESPKEHLNTPRRSTTSLSLKNDTTTDCSTPLIRSNSFTLESPSNVLLQHMVKQLANDNNNKLNTSNAIESLNCILKETNNITDDMEKSSSSISNKILPKSNKPNHEKILTLNTHALKSDRKLIPEQKIGTLLITNNSLFKNKKSPYEMKVASRTKLLKKHKNPVIRTVSAVSIKHKNRHSTKIMDNEEQNIQNIPSVTSYSMGDISKFEEKQKIKLFELLKNQQEEHKRMQEMFEQQQRLLLLELSEKHENDHVDTKKDSPQRSNYNKSLPGQEKSQRGGMEKREDNNIASSRSLKTPLHSSRISTTTDSINTKSPRRRLFGAEDNSVKNKEASINLLKRREVTVAATIINAYARGYLVRRLFKTSYVQKIVQTIRDTLIFVLDLHMETRYDQSDENIKLKARLLQQLTSALYELHKIFFQLTLKERMDIIAKDRIYRKGGHLRSPRLQ